MSVWSKELYVGHLGLPIAIKLKQDFDNSIHRIYMNRIPVAKITKFTYKLNMSSKIVVVKYWLVKFFTIYVKLYQGQLRISMVQMSSIKHVHVN